MMKDMILRELNIGGIPLGVGAALAPMAGVTDSSMRRLCAENGAIFTVSEMVSAMALTRNDAKSLALLRGRNLPAARCGSDTHLSGAASPA